MRELFNLVGKITLDGAQNVSNSINKIDKEAENASKGLNKTSGSLGSFARGMGPAIAAAAAFVFAAKTIASNSIKLADSIDKTAKRMQMSTNDTQKWDYVMRNAGGSIEDLSGSMQKLQVTAYEAYSGNKEAQKSFKALGVSVTDVNGNIKDTTTLFNDSVDALSKVKNPTERAALAQKLFGKSAKDLLPILSQSSGEIAKQREEAEKLGQVLSEDAVKNLDALGDSFATAEKAAANMAAEITSNLSPILFKLAELALDASVATRKAFAPNKIDKNNMEANALKKEIEFREDRLKKTKGTLHDEAARKREEQAIELLKRQYNIRLDISKLSAKDMKSGIPEDTTPPPSSNDNLSDADKKKIAEEKKRLAEYNEIVKELSLIWGISENDTKKSVTTLEAAKNARSDHRKFVNDEATFSVDAKEALKKDDERINKEEKGNPFDATGLPSQMNISDAIEQGKAFDDLQRKEVERTQETVNQYVNMYSEMANTVIGIFDQIYDNKIARVEQTEQREIDAIKNSQMSEGEKAAAIEKIELDADKKKRALKRKQANLDKMTGMFQIGINTAVAVMKAFSDLPPPASFIMAAIYGALGIAQIASVASKPIPMAKGNLVPAQSGGVNAIVGEGREDEIVFPLQTGIKLMVDELINRISSISVPSVRGFANSAMNSVFNQYQRAIELHLHIGTFIGDEFGLKTLERKLNTIRISESQRTGNYDLSFGGA